MNGLKQRIIGALVLISLAVIFVPMMFDEPHDERSVRTLEIPEEPPFPEVAIPDPVPSGGQAPDYYLEETTQGETVTGGRQPGQAAPRPVDTPAEPVPLVSEPGPEAATATETAAGEPQEPAAPASAGSGTSQPASQPSPQPTQDNAEFQRSLEGAWVVQLGSFGSEENARRLRDGVRERGFGAHLQEVERGEARLIRVFSGPFAEKEEAERAKKVLDDAFGVNSLVTRGAG